MYKYVQISTLLDRLDSVEKKMVDFEINTDKHKTEKSINEPSKDEKSCDKCDYETQTKSDLDHHMRENHIQPFLCDYCDFTDKTEGGLKTHIRRRHNDKINQLDYKLCDFCNFNSRLEKEMETHFQQFYVTHSRRYYNQNIQQVDEEISQMNRRGFILQTFQTAENQAKYLNRSPQSNYYMGKGPR